MTPKDKARAYSKIFRGQNPTYHRDWKRKARLKKNFIKKERKQDKSRYYKDKEKRNAANFIQRIKRLYGITLEQYKKAVDLQGGACIICLRKPPKIKLVIDHEHPRKGIPNSGGRVRGLICLWCNHKRVGRDRAEHAPLHRRTADYLESSFDMRNL